MSQDQEDRTLARWRRWARSLRREAYALYFAYRDRRTPWYARALAALVVAQAFSPIDLIPDFIPVLGYLDDLVLVPLGISLALRLIPPPVLAEARRQAEETLSLSEPLNQAGLALVIGAWLLAAVILSCLAWQVFHS
jgi:uncharacterized membrane protein YkvA (DUF1232 family)